MSTQRKHLAGRNGRAARLLLLIPEISACSGGGISRVGRSMMRLMSQSHCRRELDCRVLALGRPDDEDREGFRKEWGRRLNCYGRNRLAFSAASLAAMATWAEAVIVMHVGLGSPLVLLPRRLRPASITFIHGTEVWVPARLRHRLSLCRSDYVVANSRFTARKAAEFNPWLTDVHCCHLGIPEVRGERCQVGGESGEDLRLPTSALRPPTSDLRPLPSALLPLTSHLSPLTPTRHDILIVGRMAKGEGEKGHRELMDAMEHVVAKVPAARLLVAGTGNNAETYVAMARRSPVRERIVFLGYVPEEALRALYRQVGAFAMPSRQEGFGLVYLEAMAAGLPCLASTCDAAGEVVVDGETGLLVDPADQAAIVAAITRLLGDQAFREKLGRQGRKRFEECFTEEHFHQRMWQLLEEALTANGERHETAQAL